MLGTNAVCCFNRIRSLFQTELRHAKANLDRTPAAPANLDRTPADYVTPTRRPLSVGATTLIWSTPASRKTSKKKPGDRELESKSQYFKSDKVKVNKVWTNMWSVLPHPDTPKYVKRLRLPSTQVRAQPHGWLGQGLLKGPYGKKDKSNPDRYVPSEFFDMTKVPDDGWRYIHVEMD